MYDLIGDIHGHAGALKQLLARMDYEEIDGAWRHPHRKVIFLGDFVDRGPEQVETVRIARSMVEEGTALAVMGNHEFNAVAWATPDPDEAGEYLRPHSDKNRGQHRVYLEQVGEGSDLHYEHIEWFRTLPLYLDLEGLRVVHACWHEPSLEVLDEALDRAGRVQPGAWASLARKGTPNYEAAETVIKGLEIPLPSGAVFYDKDDNLRRDIRTRWWLQGQLTYRNLAMVPEKAIEAIPHDPVPEDVLPGYEGDKPLFVGHYWLTGDPTPLSPHIACLDYSIAGGHTESGVPGKLVGYRWNGETVIDPSRFCWVTD